MLAARLTESEARSLTRNDADVKDNHREEEGERLSGRQVDGATHIVARMLCLHPIECTP